MASVTAVPFWLLSGHWEMWREVGEKRGVRVCTLPPFLPGFVAWLPTKAPLQGPLHQHSRFHWRPSALSPHFTFAHVVPHGLTVIQPLPREA